MAGIKETKEMLGFVISVGEGAYLTLEDGKLGPGDMANFIEALMRAPAAFGDVSLIPGEVKDLDLDELEELKAFVRDDFDIPDDKAEAIVEDGINIGVLMFKLIQDIRDYEEEQWTE